jgi:dihydroorotate dehydrogenase
MSGPATKLEGREQLKFWKQHYPDIDIVSTLGVFDGEELEARRQLGANAVGGVSFLWESNNWKAAVTKILSDWVEHLEIDN